MSRFDDLTDRLNPLLVKEGRQILKSRFFAASFLIVLGVGWFLALSSPMVRLADALDTAGRELFLNYYALLAAALCVPVPFAAMYSFAFEQRDQAIEMLRISRLSAPQIVRGKLLVALLHAGLYVAALVPFMCFAYLLRGIDLLVILGLTIELLCIATALTMFALWMGTLSRTPTRLTLAASALVAGMLLAFGNCALLLQAHDLGMGICFLIPMIVAARMFQEFAVLVTRQRPLRSVVLFVDLRRLQLLIPVIGEATGLIQQHFPLEGQPFSTAAEPVPFRVAHRRIMERIRKLNSLICRSTEFQDRWNFVTYDEAEPSLRQVRLMLDLLLSIYGWSPDALLMPFEREFELYPWLRFPDLDPRVLERLDEAAAELERVCVSLGAAIELPISRRPHPDFR